MSNYVEPPLDMDSLIPGQGGKNVHNHKLAEGDNIFRILPPFGVNNSGKLMAEWWLHWGFTDRNGKIRPLVCSKKYEKYCPICEAAQELYKRKMEIIKDYMDTNGSIQWKLVDPETSNKYKELNTTWQNIKAQRRFLYNAMDVSGQVGILSLPKTAAELLGAKITDAIRRMSFNPVSLTEGCAFNIKKIKSGSAKWDVKYEVELYTKPEKLPSGKIALAPNQMPVPDSVFNNYDKLAIDIHSLYKVRTAAELKRVMDGDISVFDDSTSNGIGKKANANVAPVAAEPVMDKPVIAAPATPVVNSTPIAEPTANSSDNLDEKKMQEIYKTLGIGQIGSK